MINIFLNGKQMEINAQISVQDLIIAQGLKDKMIAVAINMKIIHKNEYEKTIVAENDKIEIVRPVGGG